MPPLIALLGLLSSIAPTRDFFQKRSIDKINRAGEEERVQIVSRAETARIKRLKELAQALASSQQTAKAETPPVQPTPQTNLADILDTLIREKSKQYGYNPRLFDAIIATETGNTYNPRAFRQEPPSKSYPQGVASYGLGQLLEPTARELGYQGDVEGLYDPATSIDLIGKYLEKKRSVYPQANFNDPLEIYRIYNTGNPRGKFAPGAEESFKKKYQASTAKKRYGTPDL